MSWQQWVLVAYFAGRALMAVANIGKDRKPIDPPTATIMLLILAGLVALVVTA